MVILQISDLLIASLNLLNSFNLDPVIPALAGTDKNYMDKKYNSFMFKETFTSITILQVTRYDAVNTSLLSSLHNA